MLEEDFKALEAFFDLSSIWEEDIVLPKKIKKLERKNHCLYLSNALIDAASDEAQRQSVFANKKINRCNVIECAILHYLRYLQSKQKESVIKNSKGVEIE